MSLGVIRQDVLSCPVTENNKSLRAPDLKYDEFREQC